MRLAWTAAWLGGLTIAGMASEPAQPAFPAAILVTAPDSGWLPWLGVAVAGVAAGLGFLWWRNRRSTRASGPSGLAVPFSGDRYRTLFDNAPVQILEEDFTAIEEAFAQLRAEGVANLMTHLRSHPQLQRAWRRLLRVKDANRPAIAAAGFGSKQELLTRLPQHGIAPYPEVFDCQVGALWLRHRYFQEEFRYLDTNGQERACLMLCRVAEREERPDFSRVTLVLLDITTAKRTVTAQMEKQEVLQQILARANILLWWAGVHREGGQIRWKINVPSQSYDSPLLQLATARDRGGLWEIDSCPDLEETSRRAEAALLGNLPGYRQEFRVRSKEGVTHWLNEDVSIRRLGPDNWSLIGVITDVTAQHEAEEERRKSQAQLQQILTRADCVLWQATVIQEGDKMRWPEFDMPPSAMRTRLFGTQEVMQEGRLKLWRLLNVPELPEMDRRSTEAIRSGAPGYDQEFRVIQPGATLWLHEQVSITAAGPNQWHLVGVLMDVTAQHDAEEARKASEAQLQQILVRADCMLWRANVVRRGKGTFWRSFDVPTSGLHTRLRSAGVIASGQQLWRREDVPERSAMDARAEKALLSGAPGYEQEFRVVKEARALWLHEQVMITPAGPDEWNLVGVLMDVTAQHEAEEGRRASEAQLRQILTRADCLLWQAHAVENTAGVIDWSLYIPQSSLYRELFGEDPAERPNLMWSELSVPELAEMNARSTAAIRTGAPGYEQEFRVAKPNRTYWLHEQVSITSVRPGEWNLVGVITNVTARREAEEARMASETQLKQILTRADCLLWQANAVREGDGVRWRNFAMPGSVLCERLFGARPPATGTGLWYAADTPDLPEMNRRSTEAILSGAPGYEQEFSVLRGEKTLWLHEQVSITAAGPDEWNLVGVLMDATARHEAEEARKATEAQLQQILDRADCMLWRARVTEVEGKYSWRFDVPPSGLQRRIFGSQGLVGSPTLYESFTVPEVAQMYVLGAAALRGGAPGYDHEFRIVKPERTYWLRERATITPEAPGHWLVFGLVIDISAVKEAEAVIRASEARYRLMFDLNPNPLLVYDRETLRFLAVNDAVTRLYGYTREEFLAMTAAQIRPEEDVPRFLEAVRANPAGARYADLWRHRAKDGRIIEVEISSCQLEFQGRPARMAFIRDVTEERRAQAAVRESEARYRELFESAAEGVYQTTPEGGFVNVNPSLARTFGFATPEEFLAWPGAVAESLYIKPGRRAEFLAQLGTRDFVTDFESEVRCRDGTTKWISENARAVRDAAGGLLYLQGFLSDVTGRRKALEALRESEARYRALFENIPVAILELDFREIGRRLQMLYAAGVRDLPGHLSAHPEDLAALKEEVRVAAVNETAVRWYQAESKEPFQSGLSRLFAADVLRVLQLFLESIWQGRNDGEAEVATQDFVGGRHHTYLRWWMPRSDERLSVSYAVVAAVDLTDLKRAEAALAAEKERLAVTLRAMTEGVITTDTQGVVQFMNRAAAEITQQDAAAAIGRNVAEVCVLRDTRTSEALTLPTGRVLGGGAVVDLPPHTTLVGRNGAVCLVEGCCVPVRDVDSELVGTVLVIRDVTVRHRFEEELQRASRLESIGILAGGIAHDFNNILTAIMGNITLALLDAEALTKVGRYLRDAERATLRARDLTQQLLTFAKGGDPVRAAVLLPEIVTEVAQFALHGSRVRCEFDLPDGLWLADADKGQLGQVVQNLVINAVQAMPEGGTIRIGARNETVALQSHRPLLPGDYVHISVADTGTGIKAEHLSKIFDPYFTTKQQGSGLGLTTVYSIIRKHNGHIEVESELGRGTTFHFWLPAQREQQLDLPEDREEALKPLQGRVLFMDDEEPIVQMASLLLQRLGFKVEQARDGAETVEKFTAAYAAGQPFDLVVMDLTVPGGMGGREAITELRRIDPAVKAIVSSGYSSDPVLANYRAYGFRGMVAKPYKIDDFTRVLRDVLRESRSPIPGIRPGGVARN